jgi:creatinine amidohydrolase/Fe(II)-dependent formamide hydrolase-like protein
VLPKYETVSYELLRPAQVRAIREKCPIAYIVAGALEWHGFHNPLGTDGLKAHAVCCEAALRYGGIVLPPFYQGLVGLGLGWGPEGWKGYTLGFNEVSMFEAAALGIVKALVSAEWKVIVGVTGHDVADQRDALQRAIDLGIDGVNATGFAVMEGELHDNPNPDTPLPQITHASWKRMQSRIEQIDPDIPLVMDHAAAWETSCMMYAYPKKVDLDALRIRELSSDEVFVQSAPEGMMGKNPLKYASGEMGKRIIERMGDLIGQRAIRALDELRREGNVRRYRFGV